MNEEKSKIKMYSTTASVLLTLESMYSNANPAEYKTRLDQTSTDKSYLKFRLE